MLLTIKDFERVGRYLKPVLSLALALTPGQIFSKPHANATMISKLVSYPLNCNQGFNMGHSHKLGPNRTETQRQLDRATAVRLVLRGIPQYEIAAQLGITPSQVSRDLARVRQQWQEQATMDLDRSKAVELAKLNQLEQTYWEAYELDPHSSLLDGVLKCIDRRCKLLGLDAPAKIEARTLNFTIEFDTPAYDYQAPIPTNGATVIEPGRNGTDS